MIHALELERARHRIFRFARRAVVSHRQRDGDAERRKEDVLVRRLPPKALEQVEAESVARGRQSRVHGRFAFGLCGFGGPGRAGPVVTGVLFNSPASDERQGAERQKDTDLHTVSSSPRWSSRAGFQPSSTAASMAAFICGRLMY